MSHLRSPETRANLTQGNYLASRTWSGLEARVGLDEPAALEQGRAGIARGYTEEKGEDKAIH